jgi:glycosyltransferase involved in cell wall biosynthesis
LGKNIGADMKILVVCQYFWPEPFRILDVCLGLSEKGHEVTVLTGVPNYPEGHFHKGYGIFKPLREQYRGIEIIRIPLIPRRSGSGIQLALNYLSFAVNAVIMAPFLCRDKYDVVFTYQLSPVTMALPAVFLKKIKRIPLIHYVLDLWPESMAAAGGTGEGPAYRLMGSVVSFIYKRCDLILTSSKGFMQKIILRGAEPERIVYWPQWAENVYLQSGDENPVGGMAAGTHKPVDGTNGMERPLTDIPGIQSDAFKILFAGNIGEAQGFNTLLDAAEKLKKDGFENIQWIILGDGRMRHWVEAEVKNRDLTDVFHLLGRKPVEQMPYYYDLADVLLVSLKNNELYSLTLPAKVQSYLASGKPIIAAMNGEGARIVEEAGAGLACPGEDACALAGLIEKMSSMSKDVLLGMGNKGKEYFDRNFNRELLLDQLDKHLHNLTHI